MRTIEEILLNAHNNNEKVRLFYGDSETGEDWNEIHDVFGGIGYSTGVKKVPLLIRYKNSIGGDAISTSCIVKIMINGIIVYQHPKYHSLLNLKGNIIYKEEKLFSSFRNEVKAQMMFDYLHGVRNNY